VKANLPPPNSKARALFLKLRALAERGIDGEKITARKKLVRLEAQFDFTEPDPAEIPDLFHGSFKRASKARFVCSFASNEIDIANAVKWAIESATKIPCVYRDGDLLAEATLGTVNRLKPVADYIAHSFRALIETFGTIEGVSGADHRVFVMGLYDGMMKEMRSVGQALPSRPGSQKTRKKRKPAATAPAVHVHPYTVALSLGGKIRFSAPLEEITAELAAVSLKRLT